MIATKVSIANDVIICGQKNPEFIPEPVSALEQIGKYGIHICLLRDNCHIQEKYNKQVLFLQRKKCPN